VKSFEIRFGGSGGQGLQLSARLLADALTAESWSVARSQSYEPTSRGGLSRADLVVAKQSIDYPLVTALDHLVLLDQPAVAISVPLLKPGALVIADSRRVGDIAGGDWTVHRFALSERALELGNERVANIVALGVLTGLGGLCGATTLETAIREGVPRRFTDLNLRAFTEGMAMSR